MARKNKRIYTILGAAVGTGLAAFGIRQGLRWYQQRQSARYDHTRLPESAWPVERGYQPVGDPIPTTGPLPSAPPAEGISYAERVNSDRVSDFDDRGTAFTTSETTTSRPDSSSERESALDPYGIRRTEEGTDQGLTGTDRTVTNTAHSSDLYGVNSTPGGDQSSTGTRRTWSGGGGEAGSAAVQQPGMGQGMGATQPAAGQGKPIILDNYVAPLIEHAIAFNSVMNLLRSRQRDGEGNEGTESLTEGDRNSMRAVLDQMQEHIAEVDESAMRQNPLALRSYNLTRRLRDALDNLTYSGTDLFRIHGELREELCKLARDLDASGQVTITGLDHIRQFYECG